MGLRFDWLKARKGEDPATYLDDVFRYAMARLGQREEAEDIAVEVVESLPSPCHRTDLRLYMIGMARRKIADRLRRSGREQPIVDLDAPFRFDVDSDRAVLVAQVLSLLSTDHREVLAMKYLNELSSAEIARLVGKTPGAVDSLLQRAREAFAKEWNLLTSEEVTR